MSDPISRDDKFSILCVAERVVSGNRKKSDTADVAIAAITKVYTALIALIDHEHR